ncbi:MAG TPA: hypothetical protein ENL03_02035 [Phycisphaerae bacterium]|nr:hypothetical protein [Phycisphaerae bacterium]
MTCKLPKALLLLGPTGSGKSPLGEMLQSRGFQDTSCAHFDFGLNLRQIAASEKVLESLSDSDVDFIRSVLETSALLEDDTFYIAGAILRDFISSIDTGSIIILNGLPRHLGQARQVSEIVDIRYICELCCIAEVVRARIDSNSGGDRVGRNDDSHDAIAAKMEIYDQRIMPLVDHYRKARAEINSVPVDVETTAEEMWQMLNLRIPEND